MRQQGFSLVELLVAMLIVVVTLASALAVVNPTQALFSAETEVGDMQQRIRLAADTLYARLMVAGVGAHGGAGTSSLLDVLAPIVPFRAGGVNNDPPGTYKGDTITIFSVPNGAVAAASATYWLKSDNANAVYQLMVNEGAGGADVPVVDNVVSLRFDYYGDPRPPAMRKPLADPVGPWTTYGPRPSSVAVSPFAAGENCVFFDDGSGIPKSRLPDLVAGSMTLVPLTQTLLTDGPWCPSDAAPDRWDADLLRVRSVAVVVRVQAAAASLRGAAGPLFVHPGTSRGGHRWVPDQEIRFQVTPRNLNLGR